MATANMTTPMTIPSAGGEDESGGMIISARHPG